jgi:hypothetical protein
MFTEYRFLSHPWPTPGLGVDLYVVDTYMICKKQNQELFQGNKISAEKLA